MKKNTRQRLCRGFFSLMAAGFLLFAGSATAENLTTADAEIMLHYGITQRMTKAVAEVQPGVMAMMGDLISKKMPQSSDSAVVQSMRKEMMKKRILYKKMLPVIERECQVISAPGKTEKTKPAEKKSSVSTVDPSAFIANAENSLPSN